MKSFILMLTFLTRIPIPVKFEFEEKDFARGLWFLPVTGFIIGLPLWAYNEYVNLDNAYLMSFLTIIIYISMTGGLHLDGLADYFDGIFSGRSRERILEIMKDTHVGTFGVVGLILYFIGMFALIMGAEPIVLLMMPVVGKSMGHLICSVGRYPKEKGMGMPLITYGKVWHGLIVTGTLMVFLYLNGMTYLIAGGCVLLFTLTFHFRTTQIVGGVTGDVIGASVELTQIVWLLVFAVERSL